MMPRERARLAADIFASRRTRDDVFTGLLDGFGEPAWDMLLILYIADHGGATQTPSELVEATRVEAATAAPYITWLKSQGLVQVDGDEVSLTDIGRKRMDAYLDRRGAQKDFGGLH
ncbi:hypothetical protein KV697_10770 [Sphingomonas sanguinis]|uniref:hypothetical protein n=1 Tax=Sphingomonas sanguinis TaxID=33051 RepID=UPI001C569289|nr:hypothetical protein [Sphingomonas sanguinis]QXT34317.1 hypothetical protein KV697_10770 [Sphingomonas sanguinis]